MGSLKSYFLNTDLISSKECDDVSSVENVLSPI